MYGDESTYTAGLGCSRERSKFNNTRRHTRQPKVMTLDGNIRNGYT